MKYYFAIVIFVLILCPCGISAIGDHFLFIQQNFTQSELAVRDNLYLRVLNPTRDVKFFDIRVYSFGGIALSSKTFESIPKGLSKQLVMKPGEELMFIVSYTPMQVGMYDEIKKTGPLIVIQLCDLLDEKNCQVCDSKRLMECAPTDPTINDGGNIKGGPLDVAKLAMWVFAESGDSFASRRSSPDISQFELLFCLFLAAGFILKKR